MKILVINWQDIKNPKGGGAEVHLHNIFKRIAQQGHQVTLLCCKFDGALDDEVIDGIKVIRRGSRSFFNFVVPCWYKKLKKEGFDLVIDDINKIPFYTPCYVNEPLLAISHHFFGKSIFRETNIISALYVYFAEKLVDFVYKNVPFAVVSQSTLDEFVERGFDKRNFTIIQNAIDYEYFQQYNYPKNEFPTITFFGRLKKYKSIDHLLYAFKIVSQKIENAVLYIVGRGDFQPTLERLSQKLGIRDKIKFWGYVSEEDKIKLLYQSHIVVNTSMKEGWGITNIEANACGTPVVSANVPGLKDSVSDGVSGILYEYGNIEQLAEILINLLEDKERLNSLSLGARNWAKKFSWDDSARLMLEKCIEVVDKYKTTKKS